MQSPVTSSSGHYSFRFLNPGQRQATAVEEAPSRPPRLRDGGARTSTTGLVASLLAPGSSRGGFGHGRLRVLRRACGRSNGGMQSREEPGESVRRRIDDANPEAPAVEATIASEESVSRVRGVSADHKGPGALIFRTRHGCGLDYRRVGDVFHPSGRRSSLA